MTAISKDGQDAILAIHRLRAKLVILAKNEDEQNTYTTYKYLVFTQTIQDLATLETLLEDTET